MPLPFRHVELGLYADVKATFCQPALLVIYLETFLSDLERWLSEWRIAINVSKGPTKPSLRPEGSSRTATASTLLGATPMD